MHADHILLIDLGNTRLKAVIASADNSEAFVCVHAKRDWPELLRHWLGQQQKIEQVIFASVAPTALLLQVKQLLSEYNLQLIEVKTAETLGSLVCAYPSPQHLGVDRFLGLLAAHETYKQPCLIASIGTVMCIDAVDDRGHHLGGLLAAAPWHQQKILADTFPQLQSHDGKLNEWACDTASAIISGSLYSAVDFISQSHLRAEQKMAMKVRLIVTGGGAHAIRNLLPSHDFIEHLVLNGLRQWIKYH